MIKYLALPFILVGCTAPVTDPPAHACSPRLDGEPTYCPDEKDLILIPRQEVKGEIDVYNPHHWQSIQMMFQRNIRKGQIEKNATLPSDAINSALAEFNYGSNGSTESEELLQLPSNGNQ
tara:strand:- start:2598 stop:2957 length:360 start_codon:yes stop_codon:yes gene_type:complete